MRVYYQRLLAFWLSVLASVLFLGLFLLRVSLLFSVRFFALLSPLYLLILLALSVFYELLDAHFVALESRIRLSVLGVLLWLF